MKLMTLLKKIITKGHFNKGITKLLILSTFNVFKI